MQEHELMSDPLDDVIAAFEHDRAQLAAERARLRALAEVLVNDWPQRLRPIIASNNIKTTKRSIVINEMTPDFGAEAGAGAKLSISAARIDETGRDRKFPDLIFELQQNGHVEWSIVDGFTTADRQIPINQDFPDQHVRQALAHYIGYCLRSEGSWV
jgi:hypothetical protein